MNKIQIKDCKDCPFSGWSTAGRYSKRLQHTCNLQTMGLQYRRDQKYNCFDTCPLKQSDQLVTLRLHKND